MQKISIFLLLVLMLPSLGLALAAQPSKRVLIYEYVSDPKDWKVFVELLGNNGYSVEFLDPFDVNLTESILSGYDILVIADPDVQKVNVAQLSLIMNWVKRGGGLLVDSTYIDTQGFFVTYLSGIYVSYAKLKNLSIPFDVGELYSPITVKLNPPLNYEVENVTLRDRGVLIISGLLQGKVKAEPFGIADVRDNYTLSMSLYTELDKGRIIVFPLQEFSGNLFIFEEKNYQLIINVFDWLSCRSPRRPDISFQEKRLYTYLAIAAILSALAGLLVTFSYRISTSKKWLVLAIYAATIVIAGLHTWYLAECWASLSSLFTQWGYSSSDTLRSFIYFYQDYIYGLLMAILVGLAFHVAARRARAKYLNIMKFSLGLLAGMAAISLFYAYFWLDYIPLIQNILDIYLFRLNELMLIILGVPTAWILMRQIFREKVIESFLVSSSLGRETYDKLIEGLFYGKYVFIALGAAIAVYSFSSTAYYVMPFVWIYSFTQDVGTGIAISFYFIAGLIASILMLRGALREGLKDPDLIKTLTTLIFTREFPYLLLTLNVIPSLANLLLTLAGGYRVNLLEASTPLIGIFVAYMVGYAAMWLFVKGVKTAALTVASALVILAYQLLVSQLFLSKVTTLLDRTIASGVITIAMTGTMRKMLSEFTKKTLEKPMEKREKEAVLKRREDLEKLLEKLDKALIEGRISEETYKQLKEKYEKKFAELSTR